MEAAWPWLVVAATFLVYWPSLRGGIVWNDPDYITRPELQSLRGLWRIWTEPGATQQYYPLLHSFFWIQHRLWGEHTIGYHLVTVALHAGAAVMFGRLLRRLSIAGAWIGALIFAIHPVHVASVAWITEQKNTLSLVFYLGAAALFLRFIERRRRSDYLAASGLFLLALLTKTVTATLPAALMVLLWWREGRLDLRRDRGVQALLPWLAVGVVAALFSSWVESHYVGAEGESFSLSAIERILMGGRAIWVYLGHLVWPAGLNFIYPRWTIDAGSPGQYMYPLGAVAVAAGLWLLRRRMRGPLAAYLLFVGSLVPVLGVVNLYGALYSYVWDHWQYLPDLAPIALAGSGLAWAGARLPGMWKPAGVAALSGLVVVLGSLSWRFSGIFRDEGTLYRETLRRNPDCWMAAFNLARLLEDQGGDRAEIIRLLRDALRSDPTYARMHYHLGRNLALDEATQAEAVEELREAIRLQPGYGEALVTLAIVLTGQPGRQDEAMAACRSALDLDEGNAEAHNALGRIYAQVPGHAADAIREFRRALQLRPDAAQVHYNLGLALRATPGGLAEAARHLETAAAGLPGNPRVLNDLGVALAQLQGRGGEAVAALRAAVKLKPDYAQAYNNLGLALGQTPGGVDEAVAAFTQAIRLQPRYAEAKFNLGSLLAAYPQRRDEALAWMRGAVLDDPGFARAHFAQGLLLAEAAADMPAAIREFETVLRLVPGLPEAHLNLAMILARIPERRAEARAHLLEVLRVQPEAAQARELLESLGNDGATPGP